MRAQPRPSGSSFPTPPPPLQKNPGVPPFVHNACKAVKIRVLRRSFSARRTPLAAAFKFTPPRLSLSLPPTHSSAEARRKPQAAAAATTHAPKLSMKILFRAPPFLAIPYRPPLSVPTSGACIPTGAGRVKEWATQRGGVLRPLAFLVSRRRRMRGERFARDCIQTASDESLGYRDSDWREGGRKKNVSHSLSLHLPIHI